MWTIAARELRSLFFSPLAWIILGIVQFILGLIFTIQLNQFLQPEMQAQIAQAPEAPGLTYFVVGQLYIWVGILLLFVIPALTMRLISEERRQHTLPLLFSAPISMTRIILGKYLGLMMFIGIMLAIIMLMPLSLLIGGRLDWGQLVVGLLAVILVAATFSAIGLYISALSPHPTLAAIATLGVLLLLWIIDAPPASEDKDFYNILNYLSLTNHFHTLIKGILNTQAVSYYILLTVLFLLLSIHRLDAQRI